VSARNPESKPEMDLHLKSVRLTNFDPTKYRKQADLMTAFEVNRANGEIVSLRNSLGFTDEKFLEELVGGDIATVFTDELKIDASDILKRYADQMKHLDKYVQTNLGNIKETDDMTEMMYKMLEHVKHVAQRLQVLNEEEVSYRQSIKQFTDLATQVKGYDQIQKNLEDEEVMIHTLDLQFTEIADTFKVTAEAALKLQGFSTQMLDAPELKLPLKLMQ
jgi:hypothetical protein